MGQQIQTTALKPDILSSIPGPHMMEGETASSWASDLYAYAMLCAYPNK